MAGRPPADSDNPSENSDPPEVPPPQRRRQPRDFELMERTTIIEPLLDPGERERIGYPADEEIPVSVMFELNLDHPQGMIGARERLFSLWEETVGSLIDRPLKPISPTYLTGVLSLEELRRLVTEDKHAPTFLERAILGAWPDFPIYPHIYRSVATVKADAVRRAFGATGKGIIWAVVDSGVDETHPHFQTYNTFGGAAAELHRDFTGSQSPLVDRFGHGTHVAGILAGSIGDSNKHNVHVVEHSRDEQNPNFELVREQMLDEEALASLTGVAPQCKLVSLKVLDDNGSGSTGRVLEALRYVNEDINGNGEKIRIHGVNLSLGYEFEAKWAPCGRSPICNEVNRLVKSGVVVVVSAGNTGYGVLSATTRMTSASLGMTINDPGNAALAITVGATHRDSPYTYGASYFSSRGPTADGRLKPDVLAPGEHITSCAAGRKLEAVRFPGWDKERVVVYVDETGTSMAASHVSGAIAAFLSARQEFIGQPEEVKNLFLRTASSLGRERYFEGHGLIDVMRAIQAI